MSSSILGKIAAALAASHNDVPFSTHPAYVLPDEHALDESLRHYHFGEPQTQHAKAALDWAVAHRWALCGGADFSPPAAPAPWLAAALGLDEPFAYPTQAPAAEPAPELPAPKPAPEPEPQPAPALTPTRKARTPKPNADELAAVRAALQASQAEADTLRRERDQANEWRQRAESERESLRQMLQAAEAERDEARRQRDARYRSELNQVAHLNATVAERDKAIAERNEALRERDKAQAELADLEGSCRFGVTRIRWQPHPEHAELVRIQYRREEVPLASVKNIDGAWSWKTTEGEEGKGRSEDRAREMAAFAAGVAVSDE